MGKNERKVRISRPDTNQRLEEIFDQCLRAPGAGQVRRCSKQINLACNNDVPKTKYPLQTIRERYEVLHQSTIRKFTVSMGGKTEQLTISLPKKLEGYNCRDKAPPATPDQEPSSFTQNGAVDLNLPPLSKSMENALTKLRDDVIIFDDVWFQDVFSDTMEWETAKTGIFPQGGIVLNLLTVFVYNQLKYKNDFVDAFQKTLPIGDRIKKRLCMFVAAHQVLLGSMMIPLVQMLCRWDGIVCGMLGQVGHVSSFARKYRNVCQFFGFANLKPGDSGKTLYDGLSDQDLWRWYRSGNIKRNEDIDLNEEEESLKISLRCSACFKTEGECGGKKHLLCRICMNALYCSKECQKHAWKEHKTVCSKGCINTKDVSLRMSNVNGRRVLLFSLDKHDNEASRLIDEDHADSRKGE